MKRENASALFFIAALIVGCNAFQNNPENKPSESASVAGSAVGTNRLERSQDSLIQRGKYLVTIMGCNDCHTPKKMGPNGPELDEARLLSGHPAELPLPNIDPAVLASWVLFNHSQTATVGPWGVSFAANISSDATGIGNWSDQQFFKAMREGKYKGLDNERQLLPPMPWPAYSQLTDDDLRAILTYLRSTRPVKNVVPPPVPPTSLQH